MASALSSTDFQTRTVRSTCHELVSTLRSSRVASAVAGPLPASASLSCSKSGRALPVHAVNVRMSSGTGASDTTTGAGAGGVGAGGGEVALGSPPAAVPSPTDSSSWKSRRVSLRPLPETPVSTTRPALEADTERARRTPELSAALERRALPPAVVRLGRPGVVGATCASPLSRLGVRAFGEPELRAGRLVALAGIGVGGASCTSSLVALHLWVARAFPSAVAAVTR